MIKQRHLAAIYGPTTNSYSDFFALKIYLLNLLAILIFLLPSASRADVFSVFDAISESFKNNPNQQSHADEVKAAVLRASAGMKDSKYPTVSITVGVNRYGSTTAGGAVIAPGYTSLSAGVSSGMVIYDGGVSRNNAKSAQAAARALEAEYNSTNSLVPYTKGALANNVFTEFLEIDSYKATISISQALAGQVNSIIAHVTDPVQVARLNNQLSSLNAQILTAQNSLENAKEAYKNIVYDDVPDSLETLESANDGMKTNLLPYMNDSKLALQTAQAQNQDYISKLDSLEAIRESTAAERSSLTHPSISVVAGTSYSKTQTYGFPPSGYVGGNSPYIGIQAQMNFGFGMRDRLNAEKFAVSAAERTLAAQLGDLKFAITSTINQLPGLDQETQVYSQQIQVVNQQITDFLNKNLTPGSVLGKPEIDTILDLYNSYGNSIGSYYQNLSKVLLSRFSLEVTIGTLFERLQLHDQALIERQ